MKIGVVFGNPETTTGGNALKFYASVRWTSDARTPSRKARSRRQPHQGAGGQKQAGPALQGGGVRHHVRRGHLATGDLLDIGVERTYRKERGLVLLRGERIGQGRENVKKFLQDNPDHPGDDPKTNRPWGCGEAPGAAPAAGSGPSAPDVQGGVIGLK
jgi:recombination protein RecA